jgi:hypothetical protein
VIRSLSDPDPHLIEDGASPTPLLIPSVVFPATAPLASTPFRNDTITDATLDAKFVEHRTKMSISMKESILSSQHALEKLFQGLPESAIKPRASIMIKLEQLAAQLIYVDQTLVQLTTSITTSHDITHDVMVHIQETIQTTVAPLSTLKENLEHLHQKLDSLENTLDERLPSGTHILNAGHINDRPHWSGYCYCT